MTKGKKTTRQGRSGGPQSRLSGEDGGARSPADGTPDPLEADVVEALAADHPLDLLALSSALLASLEPRWVSGPQSVVEPRLPSVRELSGVLIDSGRPPLQILAWTMANLAADDLLRQRIVRKVDPDILPPWLADLDDAEVARAWQTVDVMRDGGNVVLEVVIGDTPMTLVGFIDFNNEGALKDSFAVPDSLDEFQQLWRELSSDAAVEASVISVSDARARLIEAIDVGDRFWPPFSSDSWPQARPLLEWALRRCPPGGSGWERPTWEPADTAETVTAFLATEAGRPFLGAAHREVLSNFVALSAVDGWGDPLLLSATRVEILLTDILPSSLPGTVHDQSLLPEIVLAFLPYAHRRRGVPGSETDRALESVRRWRHTYVQLIHARAEDTAWGIAQPPSMLERLAAMVGGQATLDTLHDRPLPLEDLDLDEVPTDIRSRLQRIGGLIDGACREFFDDEIRTATRRLLRDLAVLDPATLRRKSRDDTTAAALVWLVGRTNGAVSTSRGVQNQHLMAHFGLTGSVSQRAEVVRRAICGEGAPGRELTHPRYMTGAARGRLIELRDWARKENA